MVGWRTVFFLDKIILCLCPCIDCPYNCSVVNVEVLVNLYTYFRYPCLTTFLYSFLFFFFFFHHVVIYFKMQVLVSLKNDYTLQPNLQCSTLMTCRAGGGFDFKIWVGFIFTRSRKSIFSLFLTVHYTYQKN